MRANAVVEDPLLPVRELGQRERVGEALDARRLPALELEDLRGRVRGLGAGGRILRQQLERVLARRVVEAQPEQARDDFGAEPPRHLEPRGTRVRRELARGLRRGRAPGRAGVELRHRHRAVRVRDLLRRCGRRGAGAGGRRWSSVVVVGRSSWSGRRRRVGGRRGRGRDVGTTGGSDRRLGTGRRRAAASARRRDSRASARSAGRLARKEATSVRPSGRRP